VIYLHVQHVSAARIAMKKLSVRPSVCLSVRRVPIPYYTRHLCVSSAFLLVMCIVVDYDIRLMTVLVPSGA